jgi:hypothetical protein
VIATAHDVTIEAVRLNGTEHRQRFSLHVVTLTPAICGRFVTVVREWFAAQL